MEYLKTLDCEVQLTEVDGMGNRNKWYGRMLWKLILHINGR